ncbi:MAG: exodeoxyribonuclease VII large subunit [Clostridia bacterium]|nr:exodeoxyribonuclease VII large subunit [Clostridia bacterium]
MEPIMATVSQLNAYMKRVVDGQTALNDIWIKGEISNFKDHYSGHLYITLKDDGGVLKAVMFKAAAASLTFKPEDGMKVIARGRIGVYEQSGTYQLYISEMTPDGLGELYVAYEQLKKKLGEEGLFDDDKKKPIPKYPEKVGVITAATGAAVRDIINVITRRYPYCEIIIYPAQVQGAGAKESIVAGIEYFNEKERCDTLIVGRGGGSIEDLWAFNEEIVARAIFNSEIPIISAVGHETDFTIADFVADLRAPTPSAAAEVAVPSQLELLSKISTMKTRMQQAVINGLKNKRLVIEKLSMRSPKNRIDDLRQKNDNLLKQAEKSFLLTFEGKKKELAKYLAKLDALSPLGVMARGYAIATEEDGTVIRTISKMSPGKEFSLRLADGECQCEVKEI